MEVLYKDSLRLALLICGSAVLFVRLLEVPHLPGGISFSVVLPLHYLLCCIDDALVLTRYCIYVFAALPL